MQTLPEPPLLSWTTTASRVRIALGGRTASVRKDAVTRPGNLTSCARSLAVALCCDADDVLSLLVGVKPALLTSCNPNEEASR